MTISTSDANAIIIELDYRQVDCNSGEVWKNLTSRLVILDFTSQVIKCRKQTSSQKFLSKFHLALHCS